MEVKKEKFLKDKEQQWNQTKYGTWFTTKRGKIIDVLEKKALAEALGNKKYGEVLEYGIGNGRLLEVYASHSKHITGVDISPVQLESAKKVAEQLKANFTAKTAADFSELDLKTGSFDLIICSRVLQHLYNWEEAIVHFSRLLKPNGHLILLTYNRCSVYGLKKFYEHKFKNPNKGRFHTPTQILKALKQNGLAVDYYSGALMGQPELFDENLSQLSSTLIYGLEKLAKAPLLKHLGGRHVVRSRKER